MLYLMYQEERRIAVMKQVDINKILNLLTAIINLITALILLKQAQ